MKKLVVLSVFLATVFLLHAQTMRIAQRSHSDSDRAARLNSEGNFGLSPEMEARWRKYTDSVARADSMRRADSLRRLQPGPADTNERTPHNPNHSSSHGSLLNAGKCVQKLGS